MPRYYHVGVGLPPFEFVYSGQIYTINPPDRHWVKVTERVKEKNADGDVVYVNKERFIHDETNHSTRPKKSYLDCTEDMAKHLEQGKYAQARSTFLKHENELTKEMNVEIDNLQVEHGKKIEAMRQAQLKELQQMAAEFKAEKEKLNQVKR